MCSLKFEFHLPCNSGFSPSKDCMWPYGSAAEVEYKWMGRGRQNRRNGAG